MSHRALILLTIVLMAVAGAAGFVLLENGDRATATAIPGAKTTPIFEPDKTTVADCFKHQRDKCLDQAYGNLAYRNGPIAAMNQLKADGRTHPEIIETCHSMGHAIGQASLAARPDQLGAYLTIKDQSCADGVEHGLITWAFASADGASMEKRIYRICDEIGKNNACGHPIGHGLMQYYGDQTTPALVACRDLNTRQLRRDCFDGVYMVAFIEASADRGPAMIRKDDPYFPCSTVSMEESTPCYRQLADRFDRTKSTWAAKFTACDGAGRGADACHMGLGRRVGSLRTPEEMAKICSTSPKQVTCFGYAAAQRSGMDFDAQTASELCFMAPAQVRTGCFKQLGHSLIGNLPPAQVRAECKRAGSYVKACLLSLRDAELARRGVQPDSIAP